MLIKFIQDRELGQCTTIFKDGKPYIKFKDKIHNTFNHEYITKDKDEIRFLTELGYQAVVLEFDPEPEIEVVEHVEEAKEEPETVEEKPKYQRKSSKKDGVE